jgi:hypothetical protein
VLTAHKRRAISPDKWEQIRTAHAAGIGLREIARKMNIPEGTVLESLRPAVKVAARHRADALILVAQGVETRGSSTASFGNFSSNTSLFGANYGNGIFSGNANTTGSFSGSSFTAPNRRGKARVLAIKFL